MPILKVTDLTKKFGDFTAVDNISFSLEEGEILGLLGQNGAGKTTTIQMLLHILIPDSGSVHYFGKDLFSHREEILEQINFSSAYTNLMWWLTAWENLHYLSYMYNIPKRKDRLKKVIEIFRLEKVINLEVQNLSAGQLTRLNLAKAFLNFPKVLLLDEPTASLDPEVAQYIREFLLEERKTYNTSIIITSHNMAEVEEMCDRVTVIQGGKLIVDDTPHNLAKRIENSHIQMLVSENIEGFRMFLQEKNITFSNQKKLFTIEIKTKDIAHFLEGVSKAKVSYDELGIDKPSLEDFFLSTVQNIV